MEKSLADRYPELKTYRGQGIDDPTAITRFDWTPSGFHAIILSTRGTILIQPESRGDIENTSCLSRSSCRGLSNVESIQQCRKRLDLVF